LNKKNLATAIDLSRALTSLGETPNMSVVDPGDIDDDPEEGKAGQALPIEPFFWRLDYEEDLECAYE